MFLTNLKCDLQSCGDLDEASEFLIGARTLELIVSNENGVEEKPIFIGHLNDSQVKFFINQVDTDENRYLEIYSNQTIPVKYDYFNQIQVKEFTVESIGRAIKNGFKDLNNNH